MVRLLKVKVEIETDLMAKKQQENFDENGVYSKSLMSSKIPLLTGVNLVGQPSEKVKTTTTVERE